MAVGQLLDRIRGLYLDRFAEAVNECRKDRSVEAFVEGAFATSDGETVGEGSLGLPLRTDIVVAQNGVVQESLRVDSERALSFETLSFDWEEKLQVTLSPFDWDWCQAKLFG